MDEQAKRLARAASGVDNGSTPAHEYANIFPLHLGPNLVDLANRIKANGLREEIVLLDGKVLDGRRRERACLRAGVKPRYRDFGTRESDGKDPLEFVIDTNLHRRHLNENERALAAAKYATARQGPRVGKNTESSRFATISPETPTNAEAAEKFEVSESKVDRGKKITTKGTQALQDAVADETLSLTDAATVADEPEDVQDEAVEAVRTGKSRTATAAARTAGTPKDSAPEPQPEPTDRHGVIWPERAKPALALKSELKAASKACLDLSKKCDNLSQSAIRHHVDWSSVTNQLRKIKDLLNLGMPTDVCPYCEGKGVMKGALCNPCKGDGWVGRQVYDASPKALENK